MDRSRGPVRNPSGEFVKSPWRKVENKLVEIKAVSFTGLVQAVQAVGIELAGTYAIDPDVPHITGAVTGRIQIDHPGRFSVLRKVKQFQPNAAGMSAEDGEVGAIAMAVGTHGQRSASSHGAFRHGIRQRICRPYLAHESPLPEDMGIFQRDRHAVAVRYHPCSVVSRRTCG